MKKIVCFVMALSALFAGLLFSGCATTVTSFNRSTSISASSVITATDLTVTHIDGKYINPTLSNLFFTNRWLLIPSGAHTITGSFSSHMGTANGIKTIYDFEPGHYYLISPWQRHINDTIVSIQIIDVSDDEDRRVIKAREEIESMR